ncbi:unnamed protein product [Ambrosiozyma monospora]|uniref:Unnamed protein product n=1 Tax=Ambrosiozyma monospora TaxID=43982 RepID=A0ACB5T436_AMBMO|nr:unnamed protein product [Ambrosiozyma monospora]
MCLSQFLSRYITPLNNLLKLKITTSVTLETDNMDFREAQFPRHLSFVSIGLHFKGNHILVSTFPPNLEIVELASFDDYYDRGFVVVCYESSEYERMKTTIIPGRGSTFKWKVAGS